MGIFGRFFYRYMRCVNTRDHLREVQIAAGEKPTQFEVAAILQISRFSL